jgi:hypothetical protein
MTVKTVSLDLAKDIFKFTVFQKVGAWVLSEQNHLRRSGRFRSLQR